MGIIAERLVYLYNAGNIKLLKYFLGLSSAVQQALRLLVFLTAAPTEFGQLRPIREKVKSIHGVGEGNELFRLQTAPRRMARGSQGKKNITSNN